ncbi:MAG: hypothetical protein ABJL67_13200 [Sulfitobacter sp.]
MTAVPRSLQFSGNSVSCSNDTASKHGKSRSETLDRSNILCLLPIDGAAFKSWFAPAFSKWLQAHFSNPEQVAAVFNVRNSTAWNWWNGDNRASGDAVARAFMIFPDAVAWFLAEWEGR